MLTPQLQWAGKEMDGELWTEPKKGSSLPFAQGGQRPRDRNGRQPLKMDMTWSLSEKIALRHHLDDQ